LHNIVLIRLQNNGLYLPLQQHFLTPVFLHNNIQCKVFKNELEKTSSEPIQSCYRKDIFQTLIQNSFRFQ
jgi:hypothetical protein